MRRQIVEGDQDPAVAQNWSCVACPLSFDVAKENSFWPLGKLRQRRCVCKGSPLQIVDNQTRALVAVPVCVQEVRR